MQPIITQWLCQNISAMFHCYVILQCCGFPRYSLPFYMTCVSLIVCYSALHIFDFVNWSFYWNSSFKILSVFWEGRQLLMSINILFLWFCQWLLQKMANKIQLFFPTVLYAYFTEHADIMLLYACILLGTHITYFLCICKVSEHLTSLSLRIVSEN